MPADYTEALERALGRVVGDMQRQFDVYKAQADALIAGLGARLAEAETRCKALEADVDRRVSERLASLRDGADADMAEVERMVESAVLRTVEPPLPAPDLSGFALREDVIALTARMDAWPDPVEPDLSGFATRDAVAEVVTAAIAELPQPAPPPDLSGLATKADLEAVRTAIPTIPELPDLSGFARREDVDAVERRISAEPDLSEFATWADVEAVRAGIPVLPDMSGFALLADVARVESRITGDPDLSGLATKADLEAVRAAIPQPLDVSGFAMRSELDALRAEIPEPTEPQDISHLATKDDVEAAVEAALASVPRPEPQRDWTPDIQSLAGEAKAGFAELRQMIERHPGTFPVVRAWSDRVHYAGEVVVAKGGTFQALRDTGREPPHEDWACLAADGSQGAPGRSFTVRGTFAPDAAYQALDVVAFDGSAFVAKTNNPGACPGEGWQLIASRGGRGKPGDSVKGDKGDPGEPVVAAEISDRGVLTLINGDGSTVTADFYPILASLK